MRKFKLKTTQTHQIGSKLLKEDIYYMLTLGHKKTP